MTGIGLARASKARSLANFAGTQGDGTTLASTGTSHVTSNNNSIALGTATGSATIVALGFFDASSGGNCWMVWDLEEPLSVVNTNVVTIDAALVKFSLGASGGLSDYLCNKLIDLIFRAQAYTFPTSMWAALFTSLPSSAGGGTEVGGGLNYARAEWPVSATNISGTQGAATTTSSSGTLGRISNNIAIAHGIPSGDWGDVLAGGLYDASTLGNLLFWHELTAPQSVASGSPAPTYQPDRLGITIA